MDHFYSACVLQCKDSCNMESDPIPMFDPLMALRRHHSPFPLPPPLLPHSHPTPWPADKEVQLLPSLTPAGSSNPTSSGTQGEILNSSYPLICKKLSWSLKPILDGFGSLLCNTHTHPRHSPTPPTPTPPKASPRVMKCFKPFRCLCGIISLDIQTN